VKPVLVASILLIPATALLASLFALGMRRLSFGQTIRDVGPAGHAGKAGTPTMGGGLILVLWAVTSVLLTRAGSWGRLETAVLTSGLLFGGIGALDDLLSLARARSLGLTGWQKMALIAAAAVGLYFLFPDVLSTPVRVPFCSIVVSLPWWGSLLLVWFVFASTTNAANLTDGLDGLAAGSSLLILAGFMILVPMPGVFRLLAPLAAILLGFLWINSHPAGLFLGDVGSFGLGGVIAAFALGNGLAFILPILAGLFVLETASVILQVACYKVTGRRLFRMSPLHHHFEASAAPSRSSILPSPLWIETAVTARFLILQALFVGMAIAAVYTG